MKNPEIEVSTDIERKINEMLCSATEASDDRSLDYKMPPNGYFVHYPMVQVHVANGTIALRCFGTVSYLKDTVGLEAYLSQLTAPLIEKHHEEVFRVSEQTQV